PHKYANAIEIPRRLPVLHGGPEPDRLRLVSIVYIPEREIGHNPPAFGVLSHFIGDRHHEPACEHPAGLTGGVPDQAPVLGRDRSRRLCIWNWWGFRAESRKAFPVVGRFRRARHRRRRNLLGLAALLAGLL